MSDIETAKSASTASFVTALVFNSALFGIQIGLFTVLRPYFKSIYEPLTYVKHARPLVPPRSKSPSSKSSTLSQFFLWPYQLIFKSDYRAIIKLNGLDAYFFVRFLRVFTITLIPIWLISWVVLLPITSVNTSVPPLSGLDIFTFGNVETSKKARYAAHIILIYGFTFWIFYVIRKEMQHFLVTRQQHLIEKTHAKSVQANTILITGIPKPYLSHEALYNLFNSFPGGVKKIWINRDLRDLPDVYDRRMDASSKLESAETSLLRTATKIHFSSHPPSDPTATTTTTTDTNTKSPTTIQVDIPPTSRPTHKLGFLGLWGEKVDSITWARTKVAECTRLLDEAREKIEGADADDYAEFEGHHLPDDDLLLQGAALDEEGNPRVPAPGSSKTGREIVKELDPKKVVKGTGVVVKKGGRAVKKGAEAVKGRIGVKKGDHDDDVDVMYPKMNSAFVMFRKQIAAHLAVQVIAHHGPYRMSNRYIEVAPRDVIWANLNLNPYEMKIRTAASYALTAALIILWAFPVAAIGALSNLSALCGQYAFLAWVCDLPSVIVGLLQGILPPVLLAVLMMLLPIILRLLARFEGIPKYTGLELSLMTRYFVFLVINSFLIVTVSSGILSAIRAFSQNPTSIPNTLAQNLPQASTFFLTFILLQGLTGTASGFLQIVSLVIYYVKLFILGSTPRAVWGIKFNPGSVAWGTLFPNITLLVVITLGYSIISPIINGLAVLTFFLFYQLYKYLFLYVYLQPSALPDTGGMFYPKAIQHVFVGLYIQQICFCALMFLARVGGVAGGVVVVVLIVITAGFHAIINNSYGPLLSALPLSLQDRTYTSVQPSSASASGSAAPAATATATVGDADASGGSSSGGNKLDPDGARSGDETSSAAVVGDIEEGVIQTRDERVGSVPMSAEPSKGTTTSRSAAEPDLDADPESRYGFTHPAISRPQRTVWIPEDEIGMWKGEVEGCEEAGVGAARGPGQGGEVVTAWMSRKGKVDVRGGPPDLVGV